MVTCIKNLMDSLGQFETGVKRLQEYCDKVGSSEDCQRMREKMEKEKEVIAKLRAPIRAQFIELKKTEKDEDTGCYKELSDRWAKAWGQFGELQKQCKKKLREPLPNKAPVDDRNVYQQEEDDDGADQTMQSVGLQLKRYDVSAAMTEEAIQKEKAQEISEIEIGINEIQGMYHEFNDMVVEQAQPLDTALENVDHAIVDVRGGTEHLQTASKHQKSSRKKMCCIGVLLLIIIIIIVVVVAVVA